MKINSLAKMNILHEADELFDIDKEVDAHLKRVENRIKRDESRDNPPPTNEPDPEENNQEQPEEQPVEDQNDDAPQDANTGEEYNDDGQSTDYEYQDSPEGSDNVDDNYEPKQTIPELKILSTLSDSEYRLCNINILEQFQALKKNIDATINLIRRKVVTRNKRQKQVVDIVHNNLYDMLNDIDNYIMYRNKDIYEENVIAYLTYLKRYQIATRILKIIINENIKNKTE